MSKLPIYYWRYVGPVDADEYVSEGWRCWVDARECEFNIEGWLEENIQGEYEFELKFNSGKPAYRIFIKEEKDATYFALNFV